VAAGISRATAYRWREKDSKFNEDWGEAENLGVTSMEEEAVRRGMNGSDTLLIFMLKAKRPEIYRDNYMPKGKEGDLNIHNINIASLSDVQLGQLVSRLDSEIAKLINLAQGHNSPRTIDATPSGN